ncbi:uncharacterized protein M421DRAFT_150592 [Didymella exigua CBS 183.55]|uniref:Uncharacterized protein n=1 Tax=Didymella exigua CBS 183.55 TaxID=1150837 RepID=A0A6A5RME0_9PLEO|nr:uncharacterized protein M421DRAFT_150592 [Didymella exigua CBS 183.55]KAF1928603.1 hypothetical protein M421DRAFT_150592 [Didymella exigua CBS 183.55]
MDRRALAGLLLQQQTLGPPAPHIFRPGHSEFSSSRYLLNVRPVVGGDVETTPVPCELYGLLLTRLWKKLLQVEKLCRNSGCLHKVNAFFCCHELCRPLAGVESALSHCFADLRCLYYQRCGV